MREIFSDLTKDPKDCFPASALTYYKTDFGADAFEDEDRGMRIIFYDHYTLYDDSEGYGMLMRLLLYVGFRDDESAIAGTIPRIV